MAVGAASTASVIIGKTIGTGDIDLVKHYAKLMQRLFLIIGVVSGLVLFVIRVPLLRIYDLTPATQAMANTFLIIPVSYTHLDLYKRQAQYNQEGIRHSFGGRRQIINPQQRNTDYKDVYKRQIINETIKLFMLGADTLL